jgi:hypothetical protein
MLNTLTKYAMDWFWEYVGHQLPNDDLEEQTEFMRLLVELKYDELADMFKEHCLSGVDCEDLQDCIINSINWEELVKYVSRHAKKIFKSRYEEIMKELEEH